MKMSKAAKTNLSQIDSYQNCFTKIHILLKLRDMSGSLYTYPVCLVLILSIFSLIN